MTAHPLRQVPREVHVRIKRFSMEEVMSDSHWLDSRWAEKDKVSRHPEVNI